MISIRTLFESSNEEEQAVPCAKTLVARDSRLLLL